MRITVYCNGDVEVVGPVGVRHSTLNAFVSRKSGWITDKIRLFEGVNYKSKRTFSRGDYLLHKDKALTLAQKRIQHFNKLYQFPYNKIYIKNQKTRWGSCSSKNNISLNYKILFLPPRLRDYIIVHELCHLKELNHGRKFWSLVEKTMPDYLSLKKELNTYGTMLRS